MPFALIRNDLTRVKADALVNSANPMPKIGSGTDSAIYEAAGAEALLAERKKIGPLAPGMAAATPAFALQAKYIIHTVGPEWFGGAHGECDTLRACYRHSLSLAAELGCESIAFPLISTGVYGFPKDEALHIALSEIGSFLLTHEMQVTLVVFDRKAFELSHALIGEINSFIDDHLVSALEDSEYRIYPTASNRHFARRERKPRPAAAPQPDMVMEGDLLMDAAPMMAPPLTAAAPAASLDAFIGQQGQSFQQRLFELIDASGMDDVTVYKKANIDRKVFSRIRCKPDYRPTKKTAVAFGIALELDLPTLNDLLARAELALSPSSRFDLIITYFVTHHRYDMMEINAALFEYGQPILGA